MLFQNNQHFSKTRSIYQLTALRCFFLMFFVLVILIDFVDAFLAIHCVKQHSAWNKQTQSHNPFEDRVAIVILVLSLQICCVYIGGVFFLSDTQLMLVLL